MTIDVGVLGLVGCSSIDTANIDLVTKCRLAAIAGLEKQVEAINTKLKGCIDQTSRAFLFHAHSMLVIMLISLALHKFHCSRASSSAFMVLMSMCIVAWVVISLNALFKMKTVYKIASVVRGQMNDLRPSAVILQEEVEEDFRTNEGARDFILYHRTSFRISMLDFHLGRHRYICCNIMFHGISTIMISVVGCVMFAGTMKAMFYC